MNRAVCCVLYFLCCCFIPHELLCTEAISIPSEIVALKEFYTQLSNEQLSLVKNSFNKFGGLNAMAFFAKEQNNDKINSNKKQLYILCHAYDILDNSSSDVHLWGVKQVLDKIQTLGNNDKITIQPVYDNAFDVSRNSIEKYLQKLKGINSQIKDNLLKDYLYKNSETRSDVLPNIQNKNTLRICTSISKEDKLKNKGSKALNYANNVKNEYSHQTNQNSQDSVNISSQVFHTEIMYQVLRRLGIINEADGCIVSTKLSCRNCEKYMKNWTDNIDSNDPKYFFAINGAGINESDWENYSQNVTTIGNLGENQYAKFNYPIGFQEINKNVQSRQYKQVLLIDDPKRYTISTNKQDNKYILTVVKEQPNINANIGFSKWEKCENGVTEFTFDDAYKIDVTCGDNNNDENMFVSLSKVGILGDINPNPMYFYNIEQGTSQENIKKNIKFPLYISAVYQYFKDQNLKTQQYLLNNTAWESELLNSNKSLNPITNE